MPAHTPLDRIILQDAKLIAAAYQAIARSRDILAASRAGARIIVGAQNNFDDLTAGGEAASKFYMSEEWLEGFCVPCRELHYRRLRNAARPQASGF